MVRTSLTLGFRSKGNGWLWSRCIAPRLHSRRKRLVPSNQSCLTGQEQAIWSCWFAPSRSPLHPNQATCSRMRTCIIRGTCHEDPNRCWSGATDRGVLIRICGAVLTARNNFALEAFATYLKERPARVSEEELEAGH